MAAWFRDGGKKLDVLMDNVQRYRLQKQKSQEFFTDSLIG